MNLATRPPQEVDTIKTQEVINIDIQPETILKGTLYGMISIYLQVTPHGMSTMTIS